MALGTCTCLAGNYLLERAALGSQQASVNYIEITPLHGSLIMLLQQQNI